MTITLSQLKKMHQQQQKIVCLTAYDAGYAHWASQAGVDVILVGDSLGMVVQGQQTTLPVTVEEMVYHTQMVQRGNENAWCIADMPFMSDASVEVALKTAAQLMKQGLANMVKLEGGQRVLPVVETLSALGVPVCGHLGLLPQSVEKHGYKVQGKDSQTAQRLLDDAQALQQAGADMLVLECVPQALAKQITESLDIPVIGIGSGVDTSGQVLVLNDILGVTIGKLPKFAKNYLAEQGTVQKAIAAYVTEVRQQQFPSDEYILV